MLKEQIAEVFREALKSQIDSCLELYGETGMNYPNLQPNGRELGYYADQIIACFQDDYLDKPLTDAEHEIVKQEWEKAHAIELALKEQRERVIERIDKSYLYLKSVCLAAGDDGELAKGFDLAMNEALSELVALKAELEGENERD